MLGTLAMLFAMLSGLARAGDRPLALCATVPELGALTRAIGGDQVAVTVIAKPTEDPHFTPARPSQVKALSECDLYVRMGLELESGWEMILLNNSRNGRVVPGGPGFVDASVAIVPMEVPVVVVDRSMGDVHPMGNPHYLTDPINGLRVARLLRDKLVQRRPEKTAYFDARLAAFERSVDVALVGEALAETYAAEKLATLAEYGKLGTFLKEQGDYEKLGGWLKLTEPYYGTKVIDDHPMWPYFARRFGFVIVGHLEPRPGFPPTTKHLGDLIAMMKADGVPLVLASAYYDPRHARFVAENTGATVLAMANQAGARPGTEEYLGMVDYNVRQVVDALRARGGTGGSGTRP
jgi:ABC-type Zn uptake system ZnuABC Zn-binding protein ZnuA